MVKRYNVAGELGVFLRQQKNSSNFWGREHKIIHDYVLSERAELGVENLSKYVATLLNNESSVDNPVDIDDDYFYSRLDQKHDKNYEDNGTQQLQDIKTLYTKSKGFAARAIPDSQPVGASR